MLNFLEKRLFGATFEERRQYGDRRKNSGPGYVSHISTQKCVDARGRSCPMPLMELMRAIKSEPVGSVIEVLASEPASTKEIPYWATRTGHAHLGTEEKEGYWRILVRKY